MASYDINDFVALNGSAIAASLAQTRSMNFDSAEDASVFFARELDFIKSRTYDKLYPEFTALNGLFPITSEVDPGAETMTYYSYEKTGQAKIISNYSTDLPRADVKGTPQTCYVKSIGTSYGYNVQEMRASKLAGKSLDRRKGEAARYQSDRLLNALAWKGDATANLIGVLTTTNNIPLYTVPNNAGGTSKKWADKTADEILADINGMVAYVAEVTKNVERPNTLVIPANVYIDISTRRIPYTLGTVKKFLEENCPYITEIVPAPELQDTAVETNPYAAASNGLNVAFLFTKDADKLAIEHPMPFYQYPVQVENLEMKIPCEARTAGAVIYYPYSALVATGI